YQMISHRALWRLLHRDCEFRIGSIVRAGRLIGTAEVPQKADGIAAAPRTVSSCHNRSLPQCGTGYLITSSARALPIRSPRTYRTGTVKRRLAVARQSIAAVPRSA